MGKTTCPGCNGHRVRRSPRRGFFEDKLLRMVGMRPYRCHDCNRRFYGVGHRRSETVEETAPPHGEDPELPQASATENSGESKPHKSMKARA